MGDRTAGRLAMSLLLLGLAVSAPPPAVAGDAPGAIRFTGRNLLFTAVGEFRRWRVRAATIDEAAPEKSRVEVEIEVASLDTDNAERDAHLRGADFFDVERHPIASVVVERFRPIGGDAFEAEVTLDLRGTTRRFPVRFTVEDRAARRVAARFTLDRTDFSIGAPESRWNPLSIDAAVEVQVEAVVPPATQSPSPTS